MKRGTAKERLYDKRWYVQKTLFLRANPMCMCPECNGRGDAADTVDHDPPHDGDPVAFWDVSTWVPMSKRHHDRKTALYDGGFGRPRLPSPRRAKERKL